MWKRIQVAQDTAQWRAIGRLCNEMLGYTAQYELLLQCGVNVLKLVIVLYWTWSASTFIFQKLLSPLHQAKV